MGRRRTEMIEETREKLIAAARSTFASRGYADTVMDELTNDAGLTRGALYHHFDGKRGLLEAVIAANRRRNTSAIGSHHGRSGYALGWIGRGTISLRRDGTRTGDPTYRVSRWPGCAGEPIQVAESAGMRPHHRRCSEALIDEGTLVDLDPKAMAPLISGAALSGALWIANAD